MCPAVPTGVAAGPEPGECGKNERAPPGGRAGPVVTVEPGGEGCSLPRLQWGEPRRASVATSYRSARAAVEAKPVTVGTE